MREIEEGREVGREKERQRDRAIRERVTMKEEEEQTHNAESGDDSGDSEAEVSRTDDGWEGKTEFIGNYILNLLRTCPISLLCRRKDEAMIASSVSSFSCWSSSSQHPTPHTPPAPCATRVAIPARYPIRAPGAIRFRYHLPCVCARDRGGEGW